jgi:hypothetical protein
VDSPESDVLYLEVGMVGLELTLKLLSSDLVLSPFRTVVFVFLVRLHKSVSLLEVAATSWALR